MPQQLAVAVENNFTKGLITQSTGLNFPENAATDTDNCEYTLIGEVLRREGIDFETNFGTNLVSKTNKAINTYKWNNAGGDGSSQLAVTQIGQFLYFYNVSASTVSVPLSAQNIGSIVDCNVFTVIGNTFDSTTACEFTDGNGYLFVLHPSCDPFYCTYANGAVTSSIISIQMRDFAGIAEIGVADNLRPSSLTPSHQYNLQNQGWTAGNPWSASSNTYNQVGVGVRTFTIAAGLTITNGQTVYVAAYVNFTGSNTYANANMTGTVTSYSGTTLVLPLS